MSFGTEQEFDRIVGISVKDRERFLRFMGIEFDILEHDGTRLYDDNGVFSGIDISRRDDVWHVGIPHEGAIPHSGRFPYGSGEHSFQRNFDFLANYEKMLHAKDSNGRKLFKEIDIARGLGFETTTQLRAEVSIRRNENRQIMRAKAIDIMAKNPHLSRTAVAKMLGMPRESSLRSLLNEEIADRKSTYLKNAKLLRDRLDEEPGTYVQVGAGTEYYMNNASAGSLKNTLKVLQDEGYTLHDISVKQINGTHSTTVRVLAKPGVEDREIYSNLDKIKLPTDMGIYTENGGRDFRKVKEYVSVDPSRIEINYAETGGKDKDGVIELRRNVDDLSLGKNHYAQVRILVDGTHYLKGMAVYADDLPDGIDIRFNTNKKTGTPMMDKERPYDPETKQVLKPIDRDSDNPFGSNLKPVEKITKAQLHYTDKDGNEQQSAINIVKEEGDVNAWTRTLSAQFLSKQPPELAKQQLKLAYDNARTDFDEINSYTNPTVRIKALNDFADQCESDAVHLAAAPIPGQTTKFLLPVPEIKEDEVYAPGYRDGDMVALVRYPHASITEIPILKVNNNVPAAQKSIGDPATVIDAVGVNAKASERLSGADYDGDTVVVIPLNSVKVKNKPQFEALKTFDPDERYPYYKGMHVMTDSAKGNEMGKITNLITDMTALAAKGAGGPTDDEICRALMYSMVVIDAVKHKYDYKTAEKDLRIAELRKKYQPTGGPSTIMSRSGSDEYIHERKEKPFHLMTDEEKARWKNGENIYVETGKTHGEIKTPLTSRMTPEEKEMWGTGDKELRRQVTSAMLKDGRTEWVNVPNIEKVERGYLYDPYDLTSTKNRDTAPRIERVYADYATQMKELAREARKIARNLEENNRVPEMAKKYAAEVESLKAKLSIAQRNAPLERQALIMATLEWRKILDANPSLKYDNDKAKKERNLQMEAARKRLGAKKKVIGSSDNPLTDREWEAIQKGAVSKTTLRAIMQNADMGRIRELATPKTKTGISEAKLARARQMIKQSQSRIAKGQRGYSRAEICEALEISEGKLVYAMESGALPTI